MTGEKTKGRKRHIVVDIMGNLLAVIVHAANIHDTVSGIELALFAFQRYPCIEKFCADAGYRGRFIVDADEILGIGVYISEKIKPRQWEKLPWRWVVERTFSWLNSSRRLSKDYEITIVSAEAVINISHLHTLLKRLCIQVLRGAPVRGLLLLATPKDVVSRALVAMPPLKGLYYFIPSSRISVSV